MGALDQALYALGTLDTLAAQRSSVHDLDPRAKTMVTLAFVVTVMSFGRYELSALLPLTLYPLWLWAAGGIPVSYVSGKLLLAAPFVLGVGIFNPWLDTAVHVQLGSVGISGGWLSFGSIVLRFVLSVSAAVLLIAVTGFNTLCVALTRLGLPQAFAVQLLFLHRYIFVLLHEAARMQRARELRAFGRKGLGLASAAPLLGQLLLRTVDRAGRIHQAMLCRGFDGTLPLLPHRPHLSHLSLGASMRYTLRDWLFTVGWLAFFALVRWVNVPQALGEAVQLFAH